MAILYSIPEAGRLLGGVSIWTVRKHISWGNVRVTRIGRRVFLPSEEIERIRREGLPSLGVGSRKQDSDSKTEINFNGEEAGPCLTTRSK